MQESKTPNLEVVSFNLPCVKVGLTSIYRDDTHRSVYDNYSLTIITVCAVTTTFHRKPN